MKPWSAKDAGAFFVKFYLLSLFVALLGMVQRALGQRAALVTRPLQVWPSYSRTRRFRKTALCTTR